MNVKLNLTILLCRENRKTDSEEKEGGIGMNRNDKQLELNAEGFNENCGHKILGYSLFL